MYCNIYCFISIWNDIREMFHASKWHSDLRFYSPMALLDSGEHVFIRDCVSCAHPVLPSIITGLVIKLFKKVMMKL